MLVELTADETTCSICCSKFSSDTNNTDDKIRRHLPVLSSSKCDHWFCHGCVLREQQRVAGNNNGRVPKWLKCMTCRENTSFRPDEPKYHRLLIDLLGRAQRYASVQVKLEQECKIISPVCSETDESEGRESSKANVKGQCTEFGLFSIESPKHGNRLKQDSQPSLGKILDAKPSNPQFTFEDFPPVDPQNTVKVEAVPDPMMKEPPEGNNRHDSTDECQSDLSLEGEEMIESSQNSREQLLVQLMKNLQSHVTSLDAEYAAETIDEMLAYTDLMTPSFISQYPMGRTIKGARKAFGKSCPEIKMKCKTLSSEMRRIYEKETEKEAQETNGERMVEFTEQKESEEPDAIVKDPYSYEMSISKKPCLSTDLFRDNELETHAAKYTLAQESPDRRAITLRDENRACDGKPPAQQDGQCQGCLRCPDDDGPLEVHNMIERALAAPRHRNGGSDRNPSTLENPDRHDAATLVKDNCTSDCCEKPLGHCDGQCQGWLMCPANANSSEVLQKVERNAKARGGRLENHPDRRAATIGNENRACDGKPLGGLDGQYQGCLRCPENDGSLEIQNKIERALTAPRHRNGGSDRNPPTLDNPDRPAAATLGPRVQHKIERNAKARGGRAATPGINNRTCDCCGKPIGQRDGECHGPSRCPENDGSLEVLQKIDRNRKARNSKALGGGAATLDKENRSCDCCGRPLGQRHGQCQGPSRCPENDGSLDVLQKIDRNRKARRVTGLLTFSNGMFRPFEFVRRHRACFNAELAHYGPQARDSVQHPSY